ncbi:uncharacterized protein V1510DRAFT_412993 [Dipodascopsis tothii]|uniref:uncharacterized protein n=1 Tax=Dipodascopsis tothii TaxID=44089 RepID=UPI0034CF8015
MISVVLVLVLVAGWPAALAHSWIDSLQVTADNGTVTSTGYIRSYSGHYDDLETYHLMNPNGSTPLCMESQRTANYSAEYPMLVARPGDNVTASYEENGHVTVDKLETDMKAHPGSYAWFWSPTPDTEVGDFGAVLDGSADVVVGPCSFDDGRCAVSSDNSLGRTKSACHSYFTVPDVNVSGVYSFVWLWHFPKIPRTIAGAPLEYYSSCMDIQIDVDSN